MCVGLGGLGGLGGGGDNTTSLFYVTPEQNMKGPEASFAIILNTMDSSWQDRVVIVVFFFPFGTAKKG